jgi:uncharacterized protein YeaO (DUF488 family)
MLNLKRARDPVSSPDGRPGAWQPIITAERHGQVTLIYGARDTEHNNAAALRDYLLKKSRRVHD